MPKYVILGTWTEQGLKNLGQAAERYQAFAKGVADAGGRMIDMTYTLGAYDFVATLEAPNDETVTGLALKTGALGNVRTSTMRGFSVEELKGLLKRAGV